ncbi:MAG TPA: universal stress protein [Candidatus Limnocylindrales bacterium]
MQILCPTDGSPGAAAAIDMVIGTFKPVGLSVDLLAVIPSPAGGWSMAAADAQAGADALLVRERARLEAAGFAVETSTRTGHPADEIVAFAATRQPTLVILGARAQGDGRHAFTGPVASTVARYCGTSVLIARHGRPVRSIVLGYDGSPGADAAVSLLLDLPYRVRPQIAVCTAFDIVTPFTSGIAPLLRAQAVAAAEEELVAAAQAAEELALEASDRLTRGALPATPYALRGRPSEQLMVLAGETGADLIAAGSRGVSTIARFLLGSTSSELAAITSTDLLVARA